MTKARARQRAKVKAAQKARKRDAGPERPEQKARPGRFDPGPGSIKSPGMAAGPKTFGAARRGSARSR